MNRFGWADMNLVEVERPWRIVAVGRGGKYNRIKTFQSWELEPASGGGTRVEWTFETEPALPTDRLLESLRLSPLVAPARAPGAQAAAVDPRGQPRPRGPGHGGGAVTALRA